MNADNAIVIESDDDEVNTHTTSKGLAVSSSHTSHSLKIEIKRPPRVLARSRYFRGGIANPCKKEILICREIIKRQLQCHDTWNSICPVLTTVSVTMDFKLPRPLTDFVGNKRENGLKSTLAPWLQVPKKSGGIDNYAKLYLDAMIGIIYHDDSQVYILSLVKSPDNAGNGCVVITVEICHHGA